MAKDLGAKPDNVQYVNHVSPVRFWTGTMIPQRSLTRMLIGWLYRRDKAAYASQNASTPQPLPTTTPHRD